MSIETIQDLKKNWKPIKVRVADGNVFSVSHPDYLLVAPSQSAILIFNEPEGNRFSIVYKEQIVSIERDL